MMDDALPRVSFESLNPKDRVNIFATEQSTSHCQKRLLWSLFALLMVRVGVAIRD